MNNPFSLTEYSSGARDEATSSRVGLKRSAAATLFFIAAAILPTFLASAQRTPTKVTNASATTGADGTTVSIAADGSLGRAQTWQDSEGYHVVIPDTVASESLKTANGIKMRRVGTSLEIVVQTRPGAQVQVHSSDNQLNLAIAGKLAPRSIDVPPSTDSNSSELPSQVREPQYSNRSMNDGLQFNSSSSSPASSTSFSSSSDLGSKTVVSSNETAQNTTNVNPHTGPQAGVVDQNASQEQPTPVEAPSEIVVQPEDDGLVASVFSGSSVLVVMFLGLIGLLVSRKLRSRQVVTANVIEPNDEGKDSRSMSDASASGNGDAGTSLVRSGQSARVSSSNGSSGLTRQPSNRLQVAGPTALFGAYRIDQEVGKLVFGQPHRLDVLSSRAIDDRRAIETSLIKSVNSPDLDENGRRRAREALEEYGFVARQCASLLLAPEPFERASAARALGEIKSPSALPFLLEGLYDSESIVRNQAVVSIGELKLPAAIGALLDIARTHPDVPSGLLSRTLSACSVEGLDFLDAVMPEPSLLESGLDNDIVEHITHLEPTSSVEELPETSDDERLAHALGLVVSSDVQERAEAMKTLVQFRVQSAVEALARVARHDSETNLRSAAISSLGTINHESVFPWILIGMADEAREVRAAAARSLNRLSFDRSEAYVRVIETSDEGTIANVAQACIQSGIVTQNLDRLSTSDHRQAYETFSVICLLAKAKMNQPVLDAISDHSNGDVRIKAVHLLACTGQPEVSAQLRELAVKEGMGEDVKTALLEALYKLEQEQPTEEEAGSSLEDSEMQSEPLSDEADIVVPAIDFQAETIPELEVEMEVTEEVEQNHQFEFGPIAILESEAVLEEIEE